MYIQPERERESQQVWKSVKEHTHVLTWLNIHWIIKCAKRRFFRLLFSLFSIMCGRQVLVNMCWDNKLVCGWVWGWVWGGMGLEGLHTLTVVTCFNWTVRLSSSSLTHTIAGWRSLLGSRTSTWKAATENFNFLNISNRVKIHCPFICLFLYSSVSCLVFKLDGKMMKTLTPISVSQTPRWLPQMSYIIHNTSYWMNCYKGVNKLEKTFTFKEELENFHFSLFFF